MSAASTDYFIKVTPNFSTTVGAAGVASDSATTMPLVSVAGLPTDTAIELVFNRLDSSQAETNNFETVRGVISGSNLTSCVRGVEGTASGWPAGTVVEYLATADIQTRMVTGILVEHTQTGTHIPSLPLTTPKITTSINDSAGNEIIKTPATSSAVNETTITNAATGHNPIISATGGDSTIALGLAGKSAFLAATGIYAIGAAGTTETVSWENGDRQSMTLDENITITFADAVAGQTLTLYMLQDGSGTNTITFADTITWADATTPTWTTTASKMNIAVIFYSGSAYFGVGNKFA